MKSEASGKAFLGIIKHLKNTETTETILEIIDCAGAEVKNILADRILAVSWYPYSTFASFLDAVCEKRGKINRRYCFKLGEVTGKRDLETVLRIYKNISRPEQLIRSCSMVWENYYRNAGKMEALRWVPSDTVVQITGFKEMTNNHCLLMAGWMSRALEEIGLEVFQCEETKCMNRGDSCHEYFYQWKKRS